MSSHPVQPEPVLKAYGSRWIAWDDANVRIIACGESYKAVLEKAKKAGSKEPIIEYVPPSDRAFVGAQ